MPTAVFEEEAGIVARAASGDQGAAEWLVRRWEPQIQGLASAFAADNAWLNVEDLMQEGWIGFFGAVRRYRAAMGIRIQSYAVTAARNEMLKLIARKETRTASRTVLGPHGGGVCPRTFGEVGLADQFDPAMIVERRETAELRSVTIFRSTSRLPSAQREVIRLLYLLGMSTSEVAGKLGCSVQNVRQTRDRAFAKLRKKEAIKRLAS
jgi:RNA polymerase sigma factor (sigma-70 family)